VILELPAEEDIPFDTNGLLVGGISHTPGSTDIVISDSGDYFIFYTMTAFPGNQFALFLDDALVPGSIYGSTGNNYGSVIIPITAPVTLTVRNHTSTGAVTFPQPTGGTQVNVNASIRLIKLSNLPI
jgi:hypothetical protein